MLPHSNSPGCRRTFCAEEFAGDVERLASYYHDLLTIEQLLSHSAGQATQEMSLAIDNDLMSNGYGVSRGTRVVSRSVAKPSRLNKVRLTTDSNVDILVCYHSTAWRCRKQD